jgi:hypothetical protein
VCQPDLALGDYSALDVAFVPPVASLGQCTSQPGVVVGAATLLGPALACLPDSAQAAGCSGATCRLALPAPFRVCINKAPRVACPEGSPFTESTFLMSGFSLGCAPCNCNVTASGSGAVALFSDPTCTNDEFDVPADGECHEGPEGGADSFRYVANPPTDVACVLGDSASGGAGIDPQTVCCVP